MDSLETTAKGLELEVDPAMGMGSETEAATCREEAAFTVIDPEKLTGERS